MGGGGIAARIGGVEAVHVRQQDQQIRARQLGRPRRQPVVVAVTDLLGRHRVVLVDDGDDAVGQQGVDGGAAVQPAATAFGVVTRQQHLTGDQTVRLQRRRPGRHQQGLPDRGRRLLVLQPHAQPRQPPASQGDGAG